MPKGGSESGNACQQPTSWWQVGGLALRHTHHNPSRHFLAHIFVCLLAWCLGPTIALPMTVYSPETCFAVDSTFEPMAVANDATPTLGYKKHWTHCRHRVEQMSIKEDDTWRPIHLPSLHAMQIPTHKAWSVVLLGSKSSTDFEQTCDLCLFFFFLFVLSSMHSCIHQVASLTLRFIHRISISPQLT